MPTDSVLSVIKAVRILDLVAENGSVKLKDVVRELALSRSVAHRFLLTLERERMLVRDNANDSYQLGVKLIQFGHIAMEGLDLRSQARPVLEALCANVGETVHLGMGTGQSVIYIDKIEPNRTIRMYSQLGKPAPCHCTGVGKILMAFWPQKELDAYIAHGLKRYTDNTITQAEELYLEMQKVAARGWAYDNEEHEPGIKCVAAPIRDHLGVVVAAVSVAALSMRTDQAHLEWIREQTCTTAAMISNGLGYVAVP